MLSSAKNSPFQLSERISNNNNSSSDGGWNGDLDNGGGGGAGGGSRIILQPMQYIKSETVRNCDLLPLRAQSTARICPSLTNEITAEVGGCGGGGGSGSSQPGGVAAAPASPVPAAEDEEDLPAWRKKRRNVRATSCSSAMVGGVQKGGGEHLNMNGREGDMGSCA